MKQFLFPVILSFVVSALSSCSKQLSLDGMEVPMEKVSFTVAFDPEMKASLNGNSIRWTDNDDIKVWSRYEDSSISGQTGKRWYKSTDVVIKASESGDCITITASIGAKSTGLMVGRDVDDTGQGGNNSSKRYWSVPSEQTISSIPSSRTILPAIAKIDFDSTSELPQKTIPLSNLASVIRVNLTNESSWDIKEIELCSYADGVFLAGKTGWYMTYSEEKNDFQSFISEDASSSIKCTAAENDGVFVNGTYNIPVIPDYTSSTTGSLMSLSFKGTKGTETRKITANVTIKKGKGVIYEIPITIPNDDIWTGGKAGIEIQNIDNLTLLSSGSIDAIVKTNAEWSLAIKEGDNTVYSTSGLGKTLLNIPLINTSLITPRTYDITVSYGGGLSSETKQIVQPALRRINKGEFDAEFRKKLRTVYFKRGPGTTAGKVDIVDNIIYRWTSTHIFNDNYLTGALFLSFFPKLNTDYKLYLKGQAYSGTKKWVWAAITDAVINKNVTCPDSPLIKFEYIKENGTYLKEETAEFSISDETKAVVISNHGSSSTQIWKFNLTPKTE